MFPSYHNAFHPDKSHQHGRHHHHRMISEPSMTHVHNGRSVSAGSVMDHSFYHHAQYGDNHNMHYAGMINEAPMEFYHHSTTHHNEPEGVQHLEDAADHLLGLLQREAKDYSLPLPVIYYPTEFEEMDHVPDSANDGDDASKKARCTSIGPWRKRIASWMYDVVDHFKYDRNVVTIALRYIDQYVSHLLLRKGGTTGEAIVKRRHFQLIAVTSLYLAIKIHGELNEEPEKGCEPFDLVTSLLAEVDGYGVNGYRSSSSEEEDDEDSNEESDDEIRALSNKIRDLRRRHRLGRLHRLGGGHARDGVVSEKSVVTPAAAVLHPIPFKPRKRGMLSGPLRLNSFVELSRGLFTSQDITDTESKMLKALNYVVNPPTSRRYVGEFVRILGFCCNAIGENDSSCGGVTLGAGAHLAVKVGVDRRPIVQAIFASACHQTECAASVPSLSLGCLPSVVAYAAFLNATEEVFNKQHGHSQRREDGMDEDIVMEDEEKRVGSYELEDFQRHYRRFSRSQSAPIPQHHQTMQAPVMDKEHYFEAWKELFLVTVFQASNSFLCPDSEDIICVRELLLKEVTPLSTNDNTQDSADFSTEKNPSAEVSPSTKKRSPRSPRSVVGMTSARFRVSSSFFSRSSSSNVGCSPYDTLRTSFGASSKGSDTPSRQSSSSRLVTLGSNKRPYFKQVSAPIPVEHHHAGSFAANMSQFPARASTPEAPQWRYHVGGTATSNQEAGSGYDCWRSEAFQPPPFFSA
ncbi:hypothetical protein HJC23_007441 [Cyclotella cryptica]|uniref:Cyclin N-terminal domain-containing protein n=1 Tax=Cyclotella cryptica TaxID=29204 RepID=A0ABD3QHR2_9STRA|eukprot:CCRYP_005201-RA/>CCRYP_005201-RA protein AED:0.00 eAED:0.00 QI:0/-1/0/1/-1/1/1/0/743